MSANPSAMAACSFKIASDWGSGHIGEITVTNNTAAAVSNWSLNWQFANNRITSIWNAALSGSNPYTATNVGWNGSLQPGQSATFGFQVEKNGGSAELPT